jgi:YHS domain-containing protein
VAVAPADARAALTDGAAIRGDRANVDAMYDELVDTMYTHARQRAVVRHPPRHYLSEDLTMTQTRATDPVCGMSIDVAGAAGTREYDGRTYHFCSADCLRKFDAEPAPYAAGARAAEREVKSRDDA